MLVYYKIAEIYYVCAWSEDIKTKDAVLAFAGLRGIIKMIHTFRTDVKLKFLYGHGR